MNVMDDIMGVLTDGPKTAHGIVVAMVNRLTGNARFSEGVLGYALSLIQPVHKGLANLVLNRMVAMNQDKKFESKVVEGVDYYREDGKWVFTEEFLRKRGWCCKSGCRHCPYGFVREEPDPPKLS